MGARVGGRFILPALIAAASIYAVRAPVAGLEQLRVAREARLSEPAGPVRIAVVWPAEAPSCYVEGARAARDALNVGRHGGSWPPRIELVEVRGPKSARDLHARARAIAEDASILAVIGHDGSDEAISASVTYDESGLLFLAPNAMDQLLTRHMLERVFQTTPTDLDYARRVMDLVLSRAGARGAPPPSAVTDVPRAADAGAGAVNAVTGSAPSVRVAVVYPRSGYGEHFIESFRSVARRVAAVRVVLEVPYEVAGEESHEGLSPRSLSGGARFSDQLPLLRLDGRALDPHGRHGSPRGLPESEQRPLPYDMIVMPGSAPDALALIAALRGFGITAPVVGTDALDAVFRWSELEAGGAAMRSPSVPAGDVYIASIFAQAGPALGSVSRHGCADFSEDRLGVAGYAQVAILGAAVASAGSRDPKLVAVKLKSERFDVLGYSFVFDERGNIVFQGQPWVAKKLECDTAGLCRFHVDRP